MRAESRVRGPRGCTSLSKRTGQPCAGQALDGLDRCRMHVGKPLDKAKAEGAIVTEVRAWGLDDEHVEPAEVMLRLTAQAYRRAALYGELLRQAYEAAERLAAATNPPTVDDVPGVRPNATDAERAASDLDRIFTTGGVAALIGYKYGAAGKDGNLYVTEEAIRGLVDLEAAERDRAFRFAEKCRAAKVDERLIDLAESQASMVLELIRGVLADLGRSVTEPEVQRVLSARLLPLTSGAVA